MIVHNQFFNIELFKDIYDFAKQSSYRKVEDNIYNFKKNNIDGRLKDEIEQSFRQYGLTGALEVLRVQRIDTSIKVATSYHRHGEEFKENVVCFLNSNFTGGEFEYITEDIKQISPLSNTALIFGPTLIHRVLPVTEGVRYTLVAFLRENSYITKHNKTLI
jgi:hypothetical protein